MLFFMLFKVFHVLMLMYVFSLHLPAFLLYRQGTTVQPVIQPAACVAVPRPTVIRVASVCCSVLSVVAVLCHAAVSRAKALSYCLLPYGSQNQHGDKPVLMLFPDLLRPPAGTKHRNNYYPNYPGWLCPLFVHWGWIKGSSEDTAEADPSQKRRLKGWSPAAFNNVH